MNNCLSMQMRCCGTEPEQATGIIWKMLAVQAPSASRGCVHETWFLSAAVVVPLYVGYAPHSISSYERLDGNKNGTELRYQATSAYRSPRAASTSLCGLHQGTDRSSRQATSPSGCVFEFRGNANINLYLRHRRSLALPALWSQHSRGRS